MRSWLQLQPEFEVTFKTGFFFSLCKCTFKTQILDDWNSSIYLNSILSRFLVTI